MAQNGAVIVFCSSCKILYFASSVHPKIATEWAYLVQTNQGAPIDWSDIAGLEYVKTTVKEVVVFPLLRPDIFCGLRSPPKGILLFGPPGGATKPSFSAELFLREGGPKGPEPFHLLQQRKVVRFYQVHNQGLR